MINEETEEIYPKSTPVYEENAEGLNTTFDAKDISLSEVEIISSDILDPEPKVSDQTIIADETVITDIETSVDEVDATKDIISEETDNIARTVEEKTARVEPASPATTKPSRELKLLLELSKEANLDTNIAYKRKSIEHKHVEHQDHRYASAPISDGKRSMRSQNPEFVVKHQKFLSKLSNDGDSSTVSDNEEKSGKDKAQKKKEKEHFTIGGAIDATTKKLLKPAMALIKNHKDGFCWRCHREGIDIYTCETCPRSYHSKCLKHSNVNTEHWVCPECVMILNAENTKTRSPALKDMSLEQLCGLLKFALKRMTKCNDSDPFLRPVNENEFPDYKKYIVEPMDLSRMQRNIRDNLYGSTNAFEADAKWLLHNSIIFNSYQSKLTTVAKSILKVCKQEMSEIENCPTCYLNANTKENWFVEVCPKPHLLLWAKLKGFPYWPAKAMCTNSQGMVDVRFFGAHDRAWVPVRECFLYSIKDPNSHKQMKNDIIECVKELDRHIENLKEVYGEFNYAPYRTPYEPEHEVQQLQLLLPTYKPAYHTSPPRKFLKIDTLLKRKSIVDKTTPVKQLKTSEADVLDKTDSESKEMEGYGTDDEIATEGYVETQMEGRYKADSINGQEHGRRSIGVPNIPGRVKSMSRPPSGGLTRFPSNDSQRSRRNSDQSTKSDASRLSNISDKINTVDITENMEIGLSNDEVNIKISKPADITETPKAEKKSSLNICKISDKLIKKLTDTNIQATCDTKMDTIENNANDSRVQISSVDEVEKNIVESESRPSINDINQVILGPLVENVQVVQANTNNKSLANAKSDFTSTSKNDGAVEKAKPVAVITENGNDDVTLPPIEKVKENGCDNSANKVTSTTAETQNNTSSQNNLATDDLLEEMYSEEVNIAEVSNIDRYQNSKEDKVPQSKSNKRKRPDENQNNQSSPIQSKFIKLVDINAIKKSQKEQSPSVAKGGSILKNCLATTPVTNNVQKQVTETTENTLPGTIEIKSEPNSDAENETEDMEAKKQYLSALNISEKIAKVNVSKTETKMKTRTDTLKTIEKSNELNKRSLERLNSNEIQKNIIPRLIKQLPPKQRARKTFPRAITSSPKPVAKSDTPKVSKTVNLKQPSMSAESQQHNNMVIFTQPQSVVNTLTMLPSNPSIAYTGNMANPIFTMVQPSPFSNFIVPTTTLNPVPPLNPISDRTVTTITSQGDPQVSFSVSGLIASANAIFTSNAQLTNSNTQLTTTHNTNTVTTSITTTPISSVASNNTNTNVTILNGQATVPNITTNRPPASDANEDYNFLSGYIPDGIAKSLTDLIHRAPPKLKPRPPGPLNTSFDDGIPSSAGRVTSTVNSVAHKLTDYFRGVLIETLSELGTTENPEVLIASLRLENEKLRHKHSEELLEIKKNVNSILRDVQKSIIDERGRVIDETKAACELETIRRIEEVKSKQWCIICKKEAQFYCCWNTSYCDYPCQAKHWPKHLSKCTQNLNASQSESLNMKLVTPLILRKTTAPKGYATAALQKPIVSKPSKEVLNKASPNKGGVGTVKTSTVNAVALKDPKQRSFEAKNNIPSSSLSGKVLTVNKVKTISMLTPSPISSSTMSSPSQKFKVTQSKTTTTMEID